MYLFAAQTPSTAADWDVVVSRLRKALAHAESRWREALHDERTRNVAPVTLAWERYFRTIMREHNIPDNQINALWECIAPTNAR